MWFVYRLPINATCLEKVVIPDHVTRVVIWADKDLSGTGQTSAIALQERLMEQGKRVIIRLPKKHLGNLKGYGWLDKLVNEGIKDCPNRRTQQSMYKNH